MSRFLVAFGIWFLINYIGFRRGKPVTYKEWCKWIGIAFLLAVTIKILGLY